MLNVRHTIILVLLLVILAPGCNLSPELLEPELNSGMLIDEVLGEPSGITYHPTRGTIYAAGDEGTVVEMAADGEYVNWERVRFGGDFEGITVDNDTGIVYVVIEDDALLLELDPDTLEIRQEFDIVDSNPAVQNGVEAIAYVGEGRFYLGIEKQQDLLSTEMIVIQLPEAGDSEETVTVDRYPVSTREITGLYYDETSGHLIAVNDGDDLLLELSLEGEVLATRDIPGRDQEGVVVSPDGYMFIADDSDGVLRYPTNRSQ
jgi:uncharacterized protein YjiK